jgi:hypothetical protein
VLAVNAVDRAFLVVCSGNLVSIGLGKKKRSDHEALASEGDTNIGSFGGLCAKVQEILGDRIEKVVRPYHVVTVCLGHRRV